MNIRDKLDLYKCYIVTYLGCFMPSGLAYKAFNKLAGKLTCTCCIFWRGFLIGALIALIINYILILII